MFRTMLGGFALALVLTACATEPPVQQCRIGFDIGSSGIRVGSTMDGRDERAAIDYLADVWADGIIDSTTDATVAALVRMRGGSPCPAVAGGYSAWRLAVEKGGAGPVAETLDDIRRRSGVAVFVIPQAVEGAYGYVGARGQLGGRLTTPAILDIGGGSLQIATADGGWGSALGQKAWRKLFCAQVKGSADPACAANPVGAGAIDAARRLLADQMAQARAVLGSGLTMTAVSPPVVRGLHPVLAHLAARHALGGTVDSGGFDIAALDGAIALLQERDDAGIVRLLDGCRDCSTRFVSTLVTDMLLLRTVMDGVGATRLEVAEADLTNVPGILADPRAAAWAAHYDCYLAQLHRAGVDAFLASPQQVCR